MKGRYRFVQEKSSQFTKSSGSVVSYEFEADSAKEVVEQFKLFIKGCGFKNETINPLSSMRSGDYLTSPSKTVHVEDEAWEGKETVRDELSESEKSSLAALREATLQAIRSKKDSPPPIPNTTVPMLGEDS